MMGDVGVTQSKANEFCSVLFLLYFVIPSPMAGLTFLRLLLMRVFQWFARVCRSWSSAKKTLSSESFETNLHDNIIIQDFACTKINGTVFKSISNWIIVHIYIYIYIYIYIA